MNIKIKLSGILTIKTKLIASFAVILLIPALVVGSIGYNSTKTQVDKQMRNTSQQSIQVLNNYISDYVSSHKDELDVLASELKESDIKAAQNTIDVYAKAHPEALTAILANQADGSYVRPSWITGNDFDPKTKPWYTLAIASPGKGVITPAYISTSNDMVFGISKTTDDGKGVVTIVVKLQSLAAITQNVHIGIQGYVSILDTQGNYIVPPPGMKPEDKAPNSVSSGLAKYASGVDSYTDAKNKQILRAFVTNELTGWKISGDWLASEITTTASPIFQKTVLVIVISELLGALLIFYIIRSIIKPLGNLIIGARKIGTGDLSEPVPVLSNDELGQLAISFNDMRESLRSILAEFGQASEQVAAASEELTASAEETGKSTQSVAEAIQEVAAGSEKQTQDVTEGSTIINEMAVGIHKIANNAQHVSEVATATSGVALDGYQLIQTVIQQMTRAQSTVAGLSAVVRQLGDRSNKIGAIVESITEVARQTNLLALNAAIEAARAGESGRGFTVVADEVRKLANQSSEMAQQITQLVASIQSETLQTVQVTANVTNEINLGLDSVITAGDSFSKIKDSINEVTNQVHELSAAVEEISASSEDVVLTMNRIADVIKDTFSETHNVSAAAEEQLASMQEITASSNMLTQMAERLQNLINKFKV